MGSPGSQGMQSLTLEHLARPFPDRESKVGAGPQATLRGSPRGTSAEVPWSVTVAGTGSGGFGGGNGGREGEAPPLSESTPCVVGKEGAGAGGSGAGVGKAVPVEKMDDAQKRKMYREQFKKHDDSVSVL